MTERSKMQDQKSLILLILIGIVSGISSQLNWFSSNRDELSYFTIILRIAVGASVFPILFLRFRGLLYKVVYRSSLAYSVKELYPKYDIITYPVFLLPIFGAIGVQFTTTMVALMIVIFLFSQFFLIYSLMDKGQRSALFSSTAWLSFLFLISGFSALIYQIAWERALLTAFGVNIESVTIIVSIFMLGLGIGSIAGGILSKRFPLQLPQLFLLCETLTGLFGIFSLQLIKEVSSAAIDGSVLSMSLAMYALLCIPTMLMGATLPVLVAYLYNHYKNVGKSVGILYLTNTMGSALACFITADILFLFFGLKISVFVAVLCNFAVGILVYLYAKQLQGKSGSGGIQINAAPQYNSDEQGKEKSYLIFPSLILLLSAAAGYISLSQEIIWVRVLSYATGGTADVFAYVLGFFLFGIAFGSLNAHKVCEKGRIHPLTYTAAVLSISSVVFYISVPMGGKILSFTGIGLAALYLSVGLISFLSGGIFPMLCHVGIKPGASIGLPVSRIYFANILGSTAGPLFTGFVLLNFYTVEQNILLLSVLTSAIAGTVWLATPLSSHTKKTLLGGISCVIILMFLFQNEVFSQTLEKLQYKTEYPGNKRYKYTVQNRVGIIAVEGSTTDIIYGGGMYDGRFNIDPVLNTNGIRRAYMIASLHPNPKEVLEIGLSSGSWARVIANHSGVEKLTVVEINPGYTGLIKKYPEIATVLDDPKVAIFADDGRRWLNRHPDVKFDLIVSNTTFHWRNFTTNLLSEEFLRLCKNHLKPGGVVYYNSTFSEDIPFTAASMFKYVALYENFVAASDSPFVMTFHERLQNLLRFRNADNTGFSSSAFKRLAADMAGTDIADRADEIRSKQYLWHITDDNMATEFKRINNRDTWHRFYTPERRWVNLLAGDVPK